MPAMHSHATGCLPREGHVLCVALLWERSGGWEAWTFQKLEPSILIEPNEKVHSLHLFLSHTMQYVSQEIHGTARSLHVLLPPTNHVVRMRRKQEETEEERMKKNRAGNYSVGTETHEHWLLCPSVWIYDVQGMLYTHMHASLAHTDMHPHSTLSLCKGTSCISPLLNCPFLWDSWVYNIFETLCQTKLIGPNVQMSLGGQTDR